jgi:hypothetical protein
MRKAFYDLIEKALSEEQPDAEWISRLYAEMRDKLCALTPRRADMHQDIHEALDVNHFEHMVRHKAFDPADLSKLVAFAFGAFVGAVNDELVDFLITGPGCRGILRRCLNRQHQCDAGYRNSGHCSHAIISKKYVTCN